MSVRRLSEDEWERDLNELVRKIDVALHNSNFSVKLYNALGSVMELYQEGIDTMMRAAGICVNHRTRYCACRSMSLCSHCGVGSSCAPHPKDCASHGQIIWED